MELQARWLVTVDRFATSLNYHLPVYFSPFADPVSVGTDTFLQSWDGLQAYAFPPFMLIQKVLNKLCACKGTLLTLTAPYWTRRYWFPDLLSLSVAPPIILPSRTDLLRQPQSPFLSSTPEPPNASSLCVETVKRFACHQEFSHGVAQQLALCRREASRRFYQHRWVCYHRW